MKISVTLRLLGVPISAFLLSGQGLASDTVTYSYDPLGRLVATSTSGTINNGMSVSTSYDPAGNRSSYAVSGAQQFAAFSNPPGRDDNLALALLNPSGGDIGSPSGSGVTGLFDAGGTDGAVQVSRAWCDITGSPAMPPYAVADNICRASQ